jgi:multicomponent Na+:H+ antiporter subunit F
MILLLLLLTTLAGLLAICRLVKGPSQADRIIALDVLFAVAIAWCVMALVLALIGFVATVAWARLIDGSENPESL